MQTGSISIRKVEPVRHLFGEDLDDARIVSVARARRRRRKLKEDARVAVRIVQTVRESKVPNKLAKLQTQQYSLHKKKDVI